MDDLQNTAERWKLRALKAERKLAERTKEVDAIRELMNVYNLGGWTDAVAPMKRALAAEAALAQAQREHIEWMELHGKEVESAHRKAAQAQTDALEKAAKICEGLDKLWVQDAIEEHAVGRYEQSRWLEAMSDGADDCAIAIRQAMQDTGT